MKNINLHHHRPLLTRYYKNTVIKFTSNLKIRKIKIILISTLLNNDDKRMGGKQAWGTILYII